MPWRNSTHVTVLLRIAPAVLLMVSVTAMADQVGFFFHCEMGDFLFDFPD